MTLPIPCGHAADEPACPICGIARRDPRYRTHWTRPGQSPPPPPATKECVHFSDVVMSRAGPDGRACGCQTKWLYSCDLHGRCARTAAAARPGVPCCQRGRADSCPDYDDGSPGAAEINTRHLAYAVYPVAGNDWWRRNLDNLKCRWGLFNGSRNIAILTEPGKADPPGAVRDYMRGYDANFVELRNDPDLREVVAHPHLFQSVIDAGGDAPGHATFYAHAKGVTRPYNTGVSVVHWVDIAYSSLLDYWPAVAESLRAYPVTGSFKKVGVGFGGSRSVWHYSGSFLWLRNADLFAKNWREIDMQWWGAESWPSLHFSRSEAGCVFKEGVVPKLNLYNRQFVEGVVLPEWRSWSARNSAVFVGAAR